MRPRHGEIVVSRDDWRRLDADWIVGGICALLRRDHGVAEAERFMAEVLRDYGREWRSVVKRWVTVRS